MAWRDKKVRYDNSPTQSGCEHKFILPETFQRSAAQPDLAATRL